VHPIATRRRALGLRRHLRRGPHHRPDIGYVTAETALALPALVFVLALALWAVHVVSAQLRCVDAARDAARAVARGDVVATARSLAARAAPAGAEVSIAVGSDSVYVVVRARLPGAVPALPGWTVTARAAAELEPTMATARYEHGSLATDTSQAAAAPTRGHPARRWPV
jgi:Flp pilus assembly protein TadG